MSTPTPPLPQPPFYTIPNISNLRDAGSHLPLPPSSKIRPTLLFRSADVSKLDLSGWKTLKEIGIKHIFDLRSKPEIEKTLHDFSSKNITPSNAVPTTAKPVSGGAGNGEEGVGEAEWMQDLQSAGLKRHWVPVFPASDYSPERLAERYMKYMDESTEGFVHAYADILRHAGPAYREILVYLASLSPAEENRASGAGGFLSNDPHAPIPSIQDGEGEAEPKGVLVHCSAGKDRTGIFFGVLFSFLGVSREDIAAEYNLTEAGLAHVRKEVVGRLMQSPGFKKYTLEEMEGREMDAKEMAALLEHGRQAALRMIGARKESMLGALDMVDREWGSAEGYLREVVGLGDKELEGLRRALVVRA